MTNRTNSQTYEHGGLRLPTTAEIATLTGEDPFSPDYLNAPPVGEGDYYSLDGTISVGGEDAWAIFSLYKYARRPGIHYVADTEPGEVRHITLAEQNFAEAKLLVTPIGRDNSGFGYLGTRHADAGAKVQIWGSLAKPALEDATQPGPGVSSGGKDYLPATRNEDFVRIVRGEQAVKELATRVAALCLPNELDQEALLLVVQHQVESVNDTFAQAQRN